uniref:Uncharacterized protein n=1 Tax=Brassica oleracea var. oleracea TaxID=109376 RepID=A0A0D3AU52_BRAOL
MFPKWEFDVEHTLAENIIKLMFVKKPWKWTMDCWEVTAKKKVVKEDSPRLRKKTRKAAPAEASEEAAAKASEEAAAEASEEHIDAWINVLRKRYEVSNESSPNKRLTRQSLKNKN